MQCHGLDHGPRASSPKSVQDVIRISALPPLWIGCARAAPPRIAFKDGLAGRAQSRGARVPFFGAFGRRRGRRHGRALERPSPWHALAGEGCRVRHVGWRRPADRSAPAGGARAYRVSRCSRMTLMTRGLVITATTRNDAPQRGQWPMSIPNTRRKRCIQVSAARPRFAPPASSRLRTWALAPRRRGGGGEH